MQILQNDLNSLAGVMWLTIALYNVAIIVLLRIVLPKLDWSKIVLEKARLRSGPSTPDAKSAEDDPPYSYSRAIGIVGGLIIAALFWAVGNVALYYGFESPAALPDLVKGIWPLFAAGSALFLPYAFNQLANFFGGGKG